MANRLLITSGVLENFGDRAIRLAKRVMRHRERYLRAFVAATGVDPRELVLEEHTDHLGFATIHHVRVRARNEEELADALAFTRAELAGARVALIRERVAHASTRRQLLDAWRLVGLYAERASRGERELSKWGTWGDGWFKKWRARVIG